MNKKGDPLNEERGAHRGECYVCRRAKKNCLCGGVEPFSTRMRFVILMHSEEAHKQRTGTARLAKICLENAVLLTGVDFTANERVNALLNDPAYSPYVLYPGAEALNFKTMGKDRLPEGKTILVFVIDGTWRGARSILNKSRNIGALPRLSFSRGYTSRFIVKKQPMAHCVSTIEAIYYLCKEAGEAGYEKPDARTETLMYLFEELVETQVRCREKIGRRREDPGAAKT